MKILRYYERDYLFDRILENKNVKRAKEDYQWNKSFFVENKLVYENVVILNLLDLTINPADYEKRIPGTTQIYISIEGTEKLRRDFIKSGWKSQKIAISDDSALDEILPEELQCLKGGKTFVFNRRYHSRQEFTGKSFYVYEYSLEKAEETEYSYKDVVKTEEYKKLLSEFCLVDNSSELEKKNCNISFAIPIECLIKDPENLLDYEDGEKYVNKAYKVYKGGAIRKVSVYPRDSFRGKRLGSPSVVHDFNSSTLDSYVKAFEKVGELLQKWKKDLEKKGTVLVVDKKEFQEKRGVIHGKKYGI